MTITDRINAVAQRLDELADDGTSELTTLAEELGRIADEWQQPVVAMDPARKDIPEWLRNIERIVEQAAVEVVAERYGSRDPYAPYLDIRIPNHYAVKQRMADHYAKTMPFTMSSTDLTAVISGI